MPIAKNKQIELMKERINHLILEISERMNENISDERLQEYQLMLQQLANTKEQIKDEENDQYLEMKEQEQQDQEDQTEEDLKSQQQETRDSIKLGVESINGKTNQTLTPKQTLEIKKQIFQKKNSVPEFENSKQDLQEHLDEVDELSKTLGDTIDREGGQELNYSKEQGESIIQDKIIKYSNDSKSYGNENLFNRICTPTPTPEKTTNRRDEEESYYNNANTMTIPTPRPTA